MEPSGREGEVELELPLTGPRRGPARRAPVFYNPAMALDRDLNVALVTAALPEGARAAGVDLLAATGVRGLRLLRETGRFRTMVLADRGTAALAALARNAARYRPEGAAVVALDARRPGLRGPFAYVDLDPFGTPVPYLDGALALTAERGLLAVTATDMPVLAGVARGVAERRYGGRPIRGRLGPEGGLRLLLSELARRARALGRTVRPLASYVHDHHVRALVRVDGPTETPDPVALVDPASFPGPRLPAGAPYGPLWTGPLFDPELTSRLRAPAAAARPRELARWLERFREEAAAPGLFYYESNEIARELRLAEPLAPDRIVAALRAHGLAAARSHVRDGAIRTPAGRTEVGAIVRELAGRPP